MRRFFIQCIWNTSYNLPFFSKLKFVPSFNLIVWWEAAEMILSTCKIYVLINPTNMQKKENCLQINWIIIQSKFFFLFVGQEPTTWPANNCLQNNNGLLMHNAVQLCLASNNILHMRKGNCAFLLLAITLAWKWQIASLPEDIH